jgi:hypothetical protein
MSDRLSNTTTNFEGANVRRETSIGLPLERDLVRMARVDSDAERSGLLLRRVQHVLPLARPSFKLKSMRLVPLEYGMFLT